DGTPTGRDTMLGDLNAYTAPESDGKGVVILYIHDAFGWTFVNARLLCDAYAEEVGAAVYMPDFFAGEIIPADILHDPKRWGEFDFPGFLARNSRENRWPQIQSAAAALKEKYAKVAVVGFCFGGWGAFQLGSDECNPRLVDCVSVAHPSSLTTNDIDKISVPVQICAPEKDPWFTPELKRYASEVIPTKGVAFDYQHFPGMEYGFATRGDPEKEGEKRAMVRAKRAQVAWLSEWLHGE
ncbi:dienelactone hydrolase family protein, partial [Periconia macrospinosa]